MKKLIDWTVLEETPFEKIIPVARKLASDGAVLLKNEGEILPLKKGETVSVFGRTQIDYYKSGTGSGGLVRVEYEVNIIEGLRKNKKIAVNEELVKVYEELIQKYPFDKGEGWAQEPWCQYEPQISEEELKKAREKSDIAIIVLGRTAGEDRDNSADKGSWYLTDEEEALLSSVSKYFEKTVVLLNVGNIIDMNWVDKYNIKSVMYIWQGGQEGGNAVADLLCGAVTPSGKLTDTIAKSIEAYPSTKNFGNSDKNIYEEDIYVGYRYFETFKPEDVLYPFGFGLSYTEFKLKNQYAEVEKGIITVCTTVLNTGKYSGREVIQVYHSAPQGDLGKPKRTLCGFKKTKLLKPNEEETVKISFPIEIMASYDDSGITGFKSAYVLERGAYNIYVGNSVRSLSFVYSHEIGETRVTQQLTEALAPVDEFNIIYPVMKGGKFVPEYRNVSTRTVDYNKRVKSKLPNEIKYTGDKGIKLSQVKDKKHTMEEFIAQLSDDDLFAIVKGEGMCSPKVRAGSAGAIGGTTASLCDFGIPLIAVHDGPSGIRMDSGEKATSLPNGTCIACSWDEKLTQKLYSLVSVELCTHKIDSLLGPGINIHRSPLNGRNFEYFSEDPYLTGKIAASFVKGIALYKNSATVKHFMANSQEHNRREVDAVMSERAAREIYLRGFEIAVKEGNAKTIMTAYNPINGILTCESYDLNTKILREEWGFSGFVMTDWWPALKDDDTDVTRLSGLVEAQNDVFMLTNDVLTFKDDLKDALKSGKITRGQLQRNASNILNYLINSHSFERFLKYGGKLEKSLSENLNSLTDICVYENLNENEEKDLILKNTGNHLFVIEYSSNEPETSQLVLNIFINDVSAASITINGTNNKKVTVSRDVNLAFTESKLRLTYPDRLVKIEKITIKK